MEFDIYLKNHQLSFEFQDSYHYVNTWYNHDTQEIIQGRDNVKKLKSLENGLTLVDIPCWWDGSIERLMATIKFKRPDLLLPATIPSSHPISLNPPIGYFRSNDLPGVGELMLASFPGDVKFVSTISPNSWWMGEKYDGIRCCWIPSYRVVYTRNGNELGLAPHIINNLPSKRSIDCEFWFGRGQFASTYGLMNETANFSWAMLRVISFDIPSFDLHNTVYEDRYSLLLDTITYNNPQSIVATRVKSQHSKHVRGAVRAIIDEGGEGVILQQVGSIYQPGRTPTLVKVKAAQGDAEAIVVGIGDDKSVNLQLPNGTTFTVPNEDVHITSLRIGDVISFTYEGHARRSAPVSPKIYRRRTDLTWGEVVKTAERDKLQSFLTESSKVRGFSSRPIGHWTAKAMRSFLEDFAKSRKMDPLNPDTWYYACDAVCKTQGGKVILRKFKGGFYYALSQLLPEVKFNNVDFQRSYWKSIANRKQFFEAYAMMNGFDPQVAENWYKQSRERIMAFKGAKGLISHHNHNLSKALVDLYPNIGLDLPKLAIFQSRSDISYRRKFFEDYAYKHKFDPLIPENWYFQSKEDIMATKGANEVMLYYYGSVSRALMDVFPDIVLDVLKLPIQQSWKDARRRREFFEKYARDNGFDPRDPRYWYAQTKDSVLSTKGASGVLTHHKKSLSQALLDLFPDIGLERDKFRTVQSWLEPADRRKFFKEYAQQNGFDPLSPRHWHSHPKHKIWNTKGAGGVLVHHSRSVVDALIDLFPEIGLNREKLKENYSEWSDSESRRAFFESIAELKGFDSSDPVAWYSLPHEDIRNKEGAKKVLSYHDGKISKALLDLFPNIGLDESKLQKTKPLWNTPESRRRFFEEQAKEHKFNPLIATNWYDNIKKVLATKGLGKVLVYHKNNIAQALKDLFPETNFEKLKFKM